MLHHGLWHAFFGLWLFIVVAGAILWSQAGTWEGLLTLVIGLPLWIVAYGWWYERYRRGQP